jgi:hypothetical protein
VCFGGEHGDLPLIPEKAKAIARAIVQANISAILDLSGLSKNLSRKILMDFLDELYTLNRLERHVFIEETDLWAPQRTIGPDQAQCLSSVDNFVRRGGNHNLGCSMITQRSAVLNKDILTQSDCLVVLRTLAPQDKKAIQLWVEEQTDEDRRALKQWYDSLKSLENGEAWVWHPEAPEIYKKIKFRERETFHATRKFLLSPKAQTIKLMDVQEFIEKFRSVFEPKPKPPSAPLAFARPRVSPPAVPKPAPPSPPTPIPSIPAKPNIAPSAPVPPLTSKETEMVIVQQTLPSIVLEKLVPTIQVPSEPSSPLGRVLVVLLSARADKRWTRGQIESAVREHEWSTEGVDEAVNQLVRWEHLCPVQSGARTDYVLTGRDRIRVVERTYEMVA